MRLLEAVGMALRTLRAQKLKSFFSLIGVLIGVTFLIAVVSIVQGMNRYMVDRFANTLIGANTFELRQRPSIMTGNVTDDVWLEWRRRICPIHILDALIVRTDDPTGMQLAIGETEAIMRSRRGLKPWQGNNFAFQTAEGALGTWQKISKILFLALPGLVAISLVVGGIVIMNIMLMAVSERTREIGIRKARGARRADIVAQFVVESATLSLAGALRGIGFGLAL